MIKIARMTPTIPRWTVFGNGPAPVSTEAGQHLGAVAGEALRGSLHLTSATEREPKSMVNVGDHR
jgi:hypothetical protein